MRMLTVLSSVEACYVSGLMWDVNLEQEAFTPNLFIVFFVTASPPMYLSNPSNVTIGQSQIPASPFQPLTQPTRFYCLETRGWVIKLCTSKQSKLMAPHNDLSSAASKQVSLHVCLLHLSSGNIHILLWNDKFSIQVMIFYGLSEDCWLVFQVPWNYWEFLSWLLAALWIYYPSEGMQFNCHCDDIALDVGPGIGLSHFFESLPLTFLTRIHQQN